MYGTHQNLTAVHTILRENDELCLLPDQDQGAEVTHNTAHTAPSPSWSVGNRIVASIITHPVTTSHQHTSCPPDTFVS